MVDVLKQLYRIAIWSAQHRRVARPISDGVHTMRIMKCCPVSLPIGFGQHSPW